MVNRRVDSLITRLTACLKPTKYKANEARHDIGYMAEFLWQMPFLMAEDRLSITCWRVHKYKGSE